MVQLRSSQRQRNPVGAQHDTRPRTHPRALQSYHRSVSCRYHYNRALVATTVVYASSRPARCTRIRSRPCSHPQHQRLVGISAPHHRQGLLPTHFGHHQQFQPKRSKETSGHDDAQKVRTFVVSENTLPPASHHTRRTTCMQLWWSESKVAVEQSRDRNTVC